MSQASRFWRASGTDRPSWGNPEFCGQSSPSPNPVYRCLCSAQLDPKRSARRLDQRIHAPTSISLTSADDGGTEPGVNKDIDFTIIAPFAGTASFSWSYVTADTTGPQLDPFGYLLNGNFMQLSLNDGPNSQSGSTSFSVIVGDIFGFRQNSFDSLAGRATTTITNFNGPVPSGSASVPGPLPLLGLSVAFGYSSRLRKRMAARGGLNSAAGRES